MGPAPVLAPDPDQSGNNWSLSYGRFLAKGNETVSVCSASMNLEWATPLFPASRTFAASQKNWEVRQCLTLWWRREVICCEKEWSVTAHDHSKGLDWQNCLVLGSIWGKTAASDRSLDPFCGEFWDRKTLSEHFPGLQSNWRRRASV